MGFVIYSKPTGEVLRYYDSASKAQAQVTGHNRKAVMEALKGYTHLKEWAMCEWSAYEQVFAQRYASQKCYFLSRSEYF